MNRHYIVFSDGTVKAFELKDDIEQLKYADWIRVENEVEFTMEDYVHLNNALVDIYNEKNKTS